MRHISPVLTAMALAAIMALPTSSSAIDLFNIFKRKKPAETAPAGGVAALTQQQVAEGLKEALAKGVQHAVSKLGREGGFLNDAQARIPMPESLQSVERGLRFIGQDQMADTFVETMNRAAEKAVPEATSVLLDSISQMTLVDAKAILSATNAAATAYFQRTSTDTLHAKFLPIVKEATEKVGVTKAYKDMTGKVPFASSLVGGDAGDLDNYITSKALDGLFVKIAEQEMLIRESPGARTTELLQKVFGAVSRQAGSTANP